ncbi:DUF732 domain-containing protein [Mycobacterium paragordonae]|uniref:DUF732 domain-containing protein n=1 Tax=Mycobacterium paragordonae TaxID=1389713 RepID=A0A4R5WZX0_9MYCO|nr:MULTISPECIES: DUF732 domain-containing protein [Mycobacterium]MDP7735644.1 DUF732 domain-containing protein [Mycobacterium paragordonae]OBJ89307.1 hypothetical protein A9W97_14475 [Mycobacterium gordonae]TDL01441.1 DUF732 domain-containing protein [Mycobacterium paragordonae]TDL10961.1 DUF732 domain-containing protein [Mycobacterium paragordonae]
MRIVVYAACAAALIGVAAPAHADANQDQAFLVSLGAAGLTYKDPESAIAAGKKVCEMANQGKSGVEVVKVLQDGNPGLTQVNAARFTAISAGVYCPAQLPPAQPAGNGG